MRRLLLATIGLVTLCTAAIVAVMIAGGRLDPDWSRYFGPIDVCGNTLCVEGVIPGVTAPNDAIRILPPIKARMSSYEAIVGNLYVWYDFLSKPNSSEPTKIYSLLFIPIGINNKLTLGAVISRFGKPCDFQVISMGNRNNALSLYYNFGYASVTIDNWSAKITPNTSVSMQAYPDNGHPCKVSNKQLPLFHTPDDWEIQSDTQRNIP